MAEVAIDVVFAAFAVLTAARIGSKLVPGAPLASAVLGAVVGAHLVLAVLFVRRHVAIEDAPWRDVVASLPSLAIGGLVLAVVPGPGAWHPAAAAVFVAGVAFGAVSLWTLGRSFAVLPARRALVTRGPYRWLRHPAYAGELVAVIAAASAAGFDPVAWGLVAAIVPAIVVRIRIEERLLAHDPAWAQWAKRVRWRLVPGLW